VLVGSAKRSLVRTLLGQGGDGWVQTADGATNKGGWHKAARMSSDLHVSALLDASMRVRGEQSATRVGDNGGLTGDAIERCWQQSSAARRRR
jgi:hypothetical protein